MLQGLNEDCWRLVLSYVPIRDIVSSERVSRKWQEEVLRYLRDIRIRIEPALHDYEETRNNCRTLQLSELQINNDFPDTFTQVTRKLGESVVASYCFSEGNLLTVTRHCPNLTHLAFLDIGGVEFSLSDEIIKVINERQLKQISFKYMFHVTDDCISKLLSGDNLEELVICSNNNVTGRCLNDLKSTNLKSLVLDHCKNIKHQHILSAVDKLFGLTKLHLRGSLEAFQNANLMLNSMLKLEELALNYDDKVELHGDIAESIGRLSSLRRLDLSSNLNVTDEWLEAVARGCRRLEALYIDNCTVTAAAVVMLCRTVGPTLRCLNIADISRIEYHHVRECIAFCPYLEGMYPDLIMEFDDTDDEGKDSVSTSSNDSRYDSYCHCKEDEDSTSEGGGDSKWTSE